MKILTLSKYLGFCMLNIIIICVYILLYLVALLFVGLSKYCEGCAFTWEPGSPQDQQIDTFAIGLFPFSFLIFLAVLILTVKTKPQRIIHSIYLEFVILKWSSLIVFIILLPAIWYWYHGTGFIGFIFAIKDILVFGGIYLLLRILTNRIIKSIDDWKIDMKWNKLINKVKQKKTE